MLERLSRSKRNLALAGIGLLVLWFAWTVRSVLNPLILGYLLAYIVHPLVLRLERRGWRRKRAVNLIYVLGFLAITLFAAAVIQQSQSLVRTLTRENKDLFENAIARIEAFVEEHESWFAWILPDEEEGGGADAETPVEDARRPAAGAAEAGAEPDGAGDAAAEGAEGAQGAEGTEATGADATGADASERADGAAEDEGFDLAALLRALWERITEEADGRAGSVAVRGATGAWSLAHRFFGSLMALVGMIVLLPIYSYFLLFELDRIHAFVRRYIPVRERDRFSRIGRQIGEVLANFFRGRLLVCLLKGTVLAAGLAIVRVDYWLLLGMGSGFLSLVPFVGPLVGFLFASMVALLDKDFGVVGALLRTGSVFALGEMVEGYLLVPKILGDSLGLHPIVVLLSVFVGGAALGMFGLLIAVPLTASLVILVRELVLPALGAFAEEDVPPPPDTLLVVPGQGEESNGAEREAASLEALIRAWSTLAEPERRRILAIVARARE